MNARDCSSRHTRRRRPVGCNSTPLSRGTHRCRSLPRSVLLHLLVVAVACSAIGCSDDKPNDGDVSGNGLGSKSYEDIARTTRSCELHISMGEFDSAEQRNAELVEMSASANLIARLREKLDAARAQSGATGSRADAGDPAGQTSPTSAPGGSEPPSQEGSDRMVILETSMGTIRVELWPGKAPKTVANFLRYVDEGHYNGLIFHRVMDGFMIQGGGFDADMHQKTTHEQIRNEAAADRPNRKGTLAMARTSVIDSATSQFFINLVDNAFLDHRDETPEGFGYCAFGQVVEGMDIVERIGKVKTTTRAGMQNVPVETVTITGIRREK